MRLVLKLSSNACARFLNASFWLGLLYHRAFLLIPHRHEVVMSSRPRINDYIVFAFEQRDRFFCHIEPQVGQEMLNGSG